MTMAERDGGGGIIAAPSFVSYLIGPTNYVYETMFNDIPISV